MPFDIYNLFFPLPDGNLTLVEKSKSVVAMRKAADPIDILVSKHWINTNLTLITWNIIINDFERVTLWLSMSESARFTKGESKLITKIW